MDKQICPLKNEPTPLTVAQINFRQALLLAELERCSDKISQTIDLKKRAQHWERISEISHETSILCELAAKYQDAGVK